MTYVPYSGVIIGTTLIVALSFILPSLLPLRGNSTAKNTEQHRDLSASELVGFGDSRS